MRGEQDWGAGMRARISLSSHRSSPTASTNDTATRALRRRPSAGNPRAHTPRRRPRTHPTPHRDAPRAGTPPTPQPSAPSNRRRQSPCTLTARTRAWPRRRWCPQPPTPTQTLPQPARSSKAPEPQLSRRCCCHRRCCCYCWRRSSRHPRRCCCQGTCPPPSPAPPLPRVCAACFAAHARPATRGPPLMARRRPRTAQGTARKARTANKTSMDGRDIRQQNAGATTSGK